MPTDMPDLAEQLKTIAENARRLRDAGISGTVKVGDVEFTLEPPDIQPSNEAKRDATSTNALDDAATYGLPPGSAPPIFFTDPRRKA
jgi:hypothetical protein